MTTLAFINNLSPITLVILLIVGLLVFGRRLPEVGRNLGKGIIEFKKGLKGIDDDIDTAASNRQQPNNQQIAETAYRAPLSNGQDVRVSRNDPVEPATVESVNRPSGQAS